MKNYLTLFLIIAIVFLMLISFSLSTDGLADSHIDLLAGAKPTLLAQDALGEDFFDEELFQPVNYVNSKRNNSRVAIIATTEQDIMQDLLVEWCLYSKYTYRIFGDWPSVGELNDYDYLFFGEVIIGEEDVEQLEAYSALGLPMVFTKLPAFEILAQSPQLASWFGIIECVHPDYSLDGIKIFAQFFLSEERIYEPIDDLSLPYFNLKPGYQVYAVGTLQRQGIIKNENLPPLLWRTYSGQSMIFVVNGDWFPAKSLLGIISAFLAQLNEVYLYPVVNAKTIVMLNYPFLSEENSPEIMSRYLRTSQAFQRDILWPNIVKILRHYNQNYGFFALPKLDGSVATNLYPEDVLYYWKEIAKLQGTVGFSLKEGSGLSLAKVLEDNQNFFHEVLPEFKFTTLYAGDFSFDQLTKFFQQEENNHRYTHLSFVLNNFDHQEKIFQYLNNRVLAISMTKDGFEHEYQDDLQMIALQTALGFSLQQVDMSRILFPMDNRDNWGELAEKWSAGKTYYHEFQQFDSSSIYELENKTRGFLALNYSWGVKNNQVELVLDNFDQGAWFILRLHHKEVESIQGGTIQELFPQAYLIQAVEGDVIVNLRDINVFPDLKERSKP